MDRTSVHHMDLPISVLDALLPTLMGMCPRPVISVDVLASESQRLQLAYDQGRHSVYVDLKLAKESPRG